MWQVTGGPSLGPVTNPPVGDYQCPAVWGPSPSPSVTASPGAGGSGEDDSDFFWYTAGGTVLIVVITVLVVLILVWLFGQFCMVKLFACCPRRCAPTCFGFNVVVPDRGAASGGGGEPVAPDPADQAGDTSRPGISHV